MRVPAADFHETVVTRRVGQPADLFRGLRDQFGLTELIDKSHGVLSRAGVGLAIVHPIASDFFNGSLILTQRGQYLKLLASIRFTDLVHRESDVDQNPVAGGDAL